MNDTTTQLDQLAARAVTLYTRPTVAMELLRLAELPQVDATALKECIAQDPAITGKVLRVVNSSLYGLARPVGDLNQAVKLLGIKPLKLLALGFTLPDSLFAEVAARELQWYWTNTLTRAVAARMIGEQLWREAGDEAFIAALLQDIGILVLLRELGEPYAKFLSGVIEEKCHLASLEQDTLGFDHLQVSAAVLARWHLPEQLVTAIALSKRTNRLARLDPPEGDLPQILHLADMLMQLVGQQRLHVLPELLEAGKTYRGMTKSKLTSLVEGLQTQVDQLAEALALELTAERDYVQVLLKAQRSMGALGEEIAADMISRDDDGVYTELLAHTGELTDAMRAFLAGKTKATTGGVAATRSQGAHGGIKGERGATGKNGKASAEPVDEAALVRKLTAAGNRCRERRQELSLLIVQESVLEPAGDRSDGVGEHGRLAIARASGVIVAEDRAIIAIAGGRTAVVLMDCDRRGALSIAHQAIAAFGQHQSHAERDTDVAPTLSIGLATVSLVPKNFTAGKMVESAQRCLSAARACGISAVKSIEV